MFTGLVADLGSVAAVDATADGVRLTLATSLAAQLAEGDSIAVNGVCLTARAVTAGGFSADVMNETRDRSSLASAGVGSLVNLELALRAADRLGGHIMQGHVDGVGSVAAVREDGFARVVTVAAPPDLLRYVVHKGSIAVDGVSLTVARIDDDGFDVSLIPETLERTNLGAAARGQRVNLEVDVLAKYVEKLLGSSVHDAYTPDDVARMLDVAAERWPEDRKNRGRLLKRLAERGAEAARDDLAEHQTAWEQVIASTAGIAPPGTYPEGYLDALRDDWPE